MRVCVRVWEWELGREGGEVKYHARIDGVGGADKSEWKILLFYFVHYV